jgi:pseudouridine-5'-phosphate glycosidase
VITHGLPGSDGIEAARAVEDEVRAAGALPATIAVIQGRVTVGLTDADIEGLVAGGADKAGSRDLPVAVGLRRSASTTVGATCVVAQRVGIDVFATGGIGGVHRDAWRTFDESADLVDLARTGRVVVCAGIKSVLDVPATLERLETLGVVVVGFGTDVVPGFWAPTTDLPVPHRVDTPTAAAQIAQARAQLGLDQRGVLVMRPVDASEGLDQERHDALVADALEAAASAGVSGSAVTPFVLAHVHQASGGQTITANVSLLRTNAALAARIAVALRPA